MLALARHQEPEQQDSRAQNQIVEQGCKAQLAEAARHALESLFHK